MDSYYTDLIGYPAHLMTLDEALTVFDKYPKNKANRERIAKMDEGKFVVAGYRSLNSNVFIVRLPQELKDELREAEKALKKHRKS